MTSDVVNPTPDSKLSLVSPALCQALKEMFTQTEDLKKGLKKQTLPISNRPKPRLFTSEPPPSSPSIFINKSLSVDNCLSEEVVSYRGLHPGEVPEASIDR